MATGAVVRTIERHSFPVTSSFSLLYDVCFRQDGKRSHVRDDVNGHTRFSVGSIAVRAIAINEFIALIWKL